MKAVWKKIPVTVTYDGNGGGGEMAAATVDKGSKYTVLPNAFTAPDETQEFKAWEVDGQEVAPGVEITVKEDTVVKAIWKAKPADNENKPNQPDDKNKSNQPGGKDKSDLPGNQNKEKSSKPQGGSTQPKQAGKPLPRTGETGMFSIYVPVILLAVGGMLTLARKRKKDQ